MNRNARRAQAKSARTQGAAVLTPQQIEALQSAQTLLHSGDFLQCKSICEKLLRENPKVQHALHLLALAQHSLGEKENAEAAFRNLLSLYPDFTDAYCNFANILRGQKRFTEAAELYQKALALDPNRDLIHCNAGMIMMEEKHYTRALSYFLQAIMLAPQNDGYWLYYFEVLRQLNYVGIDPQILPNLCKRLARASQIEFMLTDIAMAFLISDVARQQLFILLQNKNTAEFEAALSKEETRKIVMNAVSLIILERQTVTNTHLEQLFTEARKCLLAWTFADRMKNEAKLAWIPFLYALAQQGFRNEYVYYISDEEHRLLKSLRARLEKLTENDSPDLAQCWDVLLYSCYAPLYRLSNAQILRKTGDNARDKLYTALLHKHINEPLQDARAQDDIPSFGAITDAVSQEVKEQYEDNPYPRWEEMETPTPKLLAEELRRILPGQPAHAFDGAPENPEILIAGCGTGRQVLQEARRFKNSRVLAVDLSRASLAYAIRKLREAKCDNVEFLQADILSLGQLGKSFDVIESVGVLHHMKDPVAGWKVLSGLLKPNGFMKIGLYSEKARTFVVETRALIARENYPATLDGIRQCRRDIMQNPDVKEKRRLLSMPDFYAVSDCRDLIFHVQEHRFTLPQIAEILQELKFEFLGFEHFTMRMGDYYRQEFPEDKSQTSLQNWHEYEQKNPGTFVGMYQFWLRKLPS